MSTDYRSARVALGARLRELRTEAGLDGKGIAERLGWQRSKVSRLENGKQTPSGDDLRLWAEAVERPDVTAELSGQLTGLETRYRSMRRQLANGHRARQEQAVAETEQTQMIRGLEVVRIPGLFQTAEYARHVFATNAAFRQVPDMGRVYGLGLDEEQRAFLGLALSMVGIGHVPLAAVSDLGERRLAVMLRAVARLAGNNTLAVGTRI